MKYLTQVIEYILETEGDNYREYCKDNNHNPDLIEHNTDHIYAAAVMAQRELRDLC